MHPKQIKMHGAWIQVELMVKCWKKGTFPFFCCASVPSHVSTIPADKTTKSDAVFPSICKNIYFYGCPAVHLAPSTFYTRYSLQEFFLFSKWAAQVTMAAQHLDPMCYSTAVFILDFFIHQIFGGSFFMFFCIVFYLFFPSLFWPPFLSIYPSLTFIWKNIPDALLSFSETWCLFSVP